ncbi:hypothetical protein BDK51DRAFT_38800 [Blyttiomyces helicus]|uniref:SURP motif domain-containing protein n=1 Tax=Blyttiomyces helicus TaxID=388810 RepID=A0A4P9W5U4_9FUNG|nr:hypothetical protein BDK51DRAFT_38800 [Blyttiomyces helicus]|eukprot:RKO87644.1 hypothetical protein BDK51DRAFT_38800 [Blyttiomyces helicus]
MDDSCPNNNFTNDKRRKKDLLDLPLSSHSRNPPNGRRGNSKKKKKKHPQQHNNNSSKDDLPDCLAFGYSCKIFRDDAVAADVETGSFLIPWQNSDDLLIDRFDVRHLLDVLPDSSDADIVGPFTADAPPAVLPNVHFASSSSPSSTDSDSTFDSDDSDTSESARKEAADKADAADLERRCDAERYRDVDSEEEMVFEMEWEDAFYYLEEKRKRRKMESENRLYAFDYGRGKSSERGPTGEDEAVDGVPLRATTAPTEEKVKLEYPPPPSTPHPPTQRLAAIIEKTANFIHASNNPQMEIIIQAKQAANPDFAFLTPAHPLYAYYRHVRAVLGNPLAGYGESDDDEGDGSDGEVEGKGVAAEEADISGPDPTPPLPAPDEAIIAKMASFVARNGPSFEAKVKQKNLGDPRFGFLLPWNASHKIYLRMVEEARTTIKAEEGGDADGADNPADGAGASLPSADSAVHAAEVEDACADGEAAQSQPPVDDPSEPLSSVEDPAPPPPPFEDPTPPPASVEDLPPPPPPVEYLPPPPPPPVHEADYAPGQAPPTLSDPKTQPPGTTFRLAFVILAP